MGLFSNKEGKESWLKKLSGGLSKTKANIVGRIDELIRYYRDIDDEFYEELEMILISADIGVAATNDILQTLKTHVKAEKIGDAEEIRSILRGSIEDVLKQGMAQEDGGFPLLILGFLIIRLVIGFENIFGSVGSSPYIRYFESIGFKSVVVKNYILITLTALFCAF